MTPEGKVKKKVKQLLKQHGCYQFWPVQTGYGAPTLDCLAGCNGHFFAVETKAPGKKLTPRQKLTASDIRDAGCSVFVVGESIDEDGEYSGMKTLDGWLGMVKMA